MDSKKFRESAPGKLVAIEGSEFAFVPAPLPPQWRFPERLWPLLNEASTQLGLLEGLGRHLPAANLLMRPLARREAIQSSAIEGTYATPRELLLFEIEPIDPIHDDEPANSWKEVYNSQRALDHGMTSDLPLSLRLIREMHRILLTGVRGTDRAPGEFRKLQVAIGSNRRFVPPPANQLNTCLDEFEKSINSQGSYHPLIECLLAHYQFETIHPFLDGNGRVGRMLLVVMIQRRCQLTKPWLYLSEYFAKHREEYVNHLFNVSTRAAWTSWIEFGLRGVVEVAGATAERCELLHSLRTGYLQKIHDAGGHVRLFKIVEGLFDSPFVRVADLPDTLGVTYPTAKADVERLIDAGLLTDLPDTTPRTVYAPEVFRIAYADLN